MSDGRRRLLAFFVLWLALGLDAGLSGRRLFGPIEFSTLAVSILAFAMQRRQEGAVLGALAGLIVGLLAGPNLGAWIVGLAFVGFASGWLGEAGVRQSKPIAAGVAAGAVLLVHAVLILASPPSGLGTFVGDTIRTAMVNGALAIPLHALLARLLDPEKR